MVKPMTLTQRLAAVEGRFRELEGGLGLTPGKLDELLARVSGLAEAVGNGEGRAPMEVPGVVNYGLQALGEWFEEVAGQGWSEAHRTLLDEAAVSFNRLSSLMADLEEGRPGGVRPDPVEVARARLYEHCRMTPEEEARRAEMIAEQFRAAKAREAWLGAAYAMVDDKEHGHYERDVGGAWWVEREPGVMPYFLAGEGPRGEALRERILATTFDFHHAKETALKLWASGPEAYHALYPEWDDPGLHDD